MRAMHALLRGLPTLFELSITSGEGDVGHETLLSSIELRGCTVRERRPADDDAEAAAEAEADSDAESGVAVARRVVQVLEWQAFKTGRAAPITLAVLARDKGIQKHLGSRSLLPLLQAQSLSGGGGGAPSPPPLFQLVNEESRGWCAHLSVELTASSGTVSSGTASGAARAATSVDELAAACEGIEILAIVPGAVVVNKPCGISTETVVDWLQNVPPERVRLEMAQRQREEMEEGGAQREAEEYVLESVSRLDKPTSGVLVVPLSRVAYQCLTEQCVRMTY